ncbi:MAG: hypothetical protein MUF76_09925 [Hydrogenophaga sp.]|nr:hypothetical protein [Hydrogenophaga sp.]
MNVALPTAAREPAGVLKPPRFHATAKRWHFYAGLNVFPFLTMLTTTGAVMVFFTRFQIRLGLTVNLAPQAVCPLVSEQAKAKAVLTWLPHATLTTHTAPLMPDVAS